MFSAVTHLAKCDPRDDAVLAGSIMVGCLLKIELQNILKRFHARTKHKHFAKRSPSKEL